MENNDVIIHPGYYVAELIKELDINEKELAKRMEITEDVVKKLIDQKIDLSLSLAIKLSVVSGVSISTWMNLQISYNQKKEGKGMQEKGNKLMLFPYEFTMVKLRCGDICYVCKDIGDFVRIVGSKYNIPLDDFNDELLSKSEEQRDIVEIRKFTIKLEYSQNFYNIKYNAVWVEQKVAKKDWTKGVVFWKNEN